MLPSWGPPSVSVTGVHAAALLEAGAVANPAGPESSTAGIGDPQHKPRQQAARARGAHQSLLAQQHCSLIVLRVQVQALAALSPQQERSSRRPVVANHRHRQVQHSRSSRQLHPAAPAYQQELSPICLRGVSRVP